MNLFAFQGPDGSGFQMSHQFWVFIVLTVPLTLLTVGTWFYVAHKRKRNKKLEERQRLRETEV
jgi:cytochrome c-type biogenesis protein CcmH/NrfF